MLRRSSTSLESLFDGSGGIAGHPNNVPGPRSRNRRHPAPEPCSATVRRVCSRRAGLTAARPAGLRAGKRALHSRKRKHVTMIKDVGTSGVSAAKKKRALLDDLFVDESYRCNDVASCKSIPKRRTKHSRKGSGRASVVDMQRVAKRSRLGRSSTVGLNAVCELVGEANESEADHRRRHPRLRNDCPRCRFIFFRSGWKCGPGALTRTARGKLEITSWLAERPPERGGSWGVGCVLCSAFHRRLVKECSTQGRRMKHRICTKFARFEVRSLACMQASSFDQHRRTDVHVKAVDAFLSFAKPLLRILTPLSNGDDQLFSGSVPQINTWLRVWRASLSSSFSAASQKHEH